jgi:hypothetical protein
MKPSPALAVARAAFHGRGGFIGLNDSRHVRRFSPAEME